MAQIRDIGYSVCWSCKAATEPHAFFCETCHVIQSPTDINHFERFGLEPQFALDLKDLEKRYLALQRKLHPDKFINKSFQERVFSERHAALLNEGFEILKTPVKRAFYMLKLVGLSIDEETPSTPKDPHILIEAMELRETYADITTASDAQNFNQLLTHKIDSVMAEIIRAFQHHHPEGAFHPALRLRYLTRLQDELSETQDYSVTRVVN